MVMRMDPKDVLDTIGGIAEGLCFVCGEMRSGLNKGKALLVWGLIRSDNEHLQDVVQRFERGD